MNKQKLIEKQKFNQRVSLPLEDKVTLTKQRVKDWFDYWDGEVYMSYSGGKDSHVLAEIITSMGKPYSEIPMVFSNTGLEMPEILKHVRKQKLRGWNVVEVKPAKSFDDVWRNEGIPLVSKKVARQVRTLKAGSTGEGHTYRLYDEGITSKGYNAPNWKIPNKWRFLVSVDFDISEKCCDNLKKSPFRKFQTEFKMKGKGITGIMADEGGYRAELTNCNNFSGEKTESRPMLFWTEQDVWDYVNKHEVEICDVYYDRLYDFDGMILNSSPFKDGINAMNEKLSTLELVIQKGNYQKLKDKVDDIEYHFISGEKRTGCMFCAFGAHLEKGSNRFQRMSISHPRQHKLIMDRIGMRKPLEMIDVKVDFDDEQPND